MNSLKDKKVLITGATGGIGGSLVKKFISLKFYVMGYDYSKFTYK